MSQADLIHLTGLELAGLVATGEVSAREVAEAHLARIAATDPQLHAFLHVDAAGARASADEVDRARAAGERLGPLAGVPLALKDVFVQRGVPTTCGSRILDGWIPPYDATVVQRLREAGVVILGKTNMDEFAMGSSTENSAFGPTRNPWDPQRVPGGSSGGSAAAVAAFQAPLGLGTDTGGSIRQPAAVCGLVGVKPTYGGVSRYGLVAFSSSLDQAGPLARTVADAAALHAVIGGHDPLDSTSLERPMPAVLAAAQGASADLSGVRVGWLRELSEGPGFDPGVVDAVRRAVELLGELGADVREVTCPHVGYSLATYYLIAPSECSSNLARFDGMRFGLRVADDGEQTAQQVMARTRAAGFGAEVKRRIMLGTYALSAGYYDAYYGQAQKVRALITRDFEAAFTQVDVVVSATTPTTAFRLGERAADPMAMYASDVCSIPANLTGGAAMSLPCGLASPDGLPVGLQVLAPPMADDRLYRVGAALEAALTDRGAGALWARCPAW